MHVSITLPFFSDTSRWYCKVHSKYVENVCFCNICSSFCQRYCILHIMVYDLCVSQLSCDFISPYIIYHDYRGITTSLYICTLTFITEVLHLSSAVWKFIHLPSLASKASFVFFVRCVLCTVLLRSCLSNLSMASVIIIKKLIEKSHKTCLTNHTWSKSHYVYHATGYYFL